jgi:hypothetical protein
MAFRFFSGHHSNFGENAVLNLRSGYINRDVKN